MSTRSSVPRRPRAATARRSWLVALLLALFAPEAAAAESAPMTLRAMTFNLRFASEQGSNAWPVRRPVMQACLRESKPDVIGTQEGLYPQLRDLAADLPEFEWIGLGRDGGSAGEFMAIFFRRDRFTPEAFDHFWLSDQPSLIASTNWGNTNRRMATWVRLHDRASGRRFVVINTHLDHAVQAARQKGAALVLERARRLATNELPVLLLGDFNAEPGREPTHALFVQDGFFRDAWTAARSRANEGLNTFHNFAGARPGTYRIDWILAHGPWDCAHAEVQVCSRGGQFPSDHHPVFADLELRAP